MELEYETQTLAPATAFRQQERQDHGALTRGTTIGRYVILRCLGSGGMGVVYAAWDSELDRKVALKLLRPDLADTDRVAAHARLLSEAQALARLSHPNIVAVHDAGPFEDRVFLVMEFIEGLTFTEWLSARPRSWQEVTARFHDAARGLAAVHGAGLVHRDVKPANLMVGADGRVRVVDFGLARAPISETDSKPMPAATVAMTGTPAFMAPEQHHSRVADARSDQFSFCVSLYQALYGEPPFGSGSAAQIQLRATRGEVVRPRDKSVPGWLHQALLRGLNPDPAARHPSMDDLATILSREPAARRQRWIAGLGGLVLLTLICAFSQPWRTRDSLVCQGAEGKIESIWNAQRRASLERGFLAIGRPYAARAWHVVEQSLDLYLENWARMHVEACEATRLRGEQSEALMDLRMACLSERLEEVKTMADVLSEIDERGVAKAAKMVSSLSSLRHCGDIATLTRMTPLPEDAAQRARLGDIRSRVARAKTMTDIGQAAPAAVDLEAAVIEVRQVGYRPLEAQALLRLAEARGRLGEMEKMEEILYESLAAAIAGRSERDAAMARLDLVIVGWAAGRFTEAERWAGLARASIQRLGDTELEAALRHRLGMLSNRQARYEEAIEHFSASIELKKKVYDPDDPRIGYSIGNMGIAYRHLGRYEEALKSYRDGLALVEKSYGGDHPAVASNLNNIGLVYRHMEEPREALRYLRHSLEIYEKSLAASHPDIAHALEGLGEVYIDLAEHEQAVAVLERALALRTEHRTDPLHIASTRFNLARALVARPFASDAGAVDRARQLVDEARHVCVDLGPRAHKTLQQIDGWLAEQGWAS